MSQDGRTWFRIGLLSFGGPAGQIALMQRMLVDELGWIDQRRFLTGLNFCMVLPGPEAQQLATYIGWVRHGWRGALVAGGLFILPGAAVMAVLSLSYAMFGQVPAVTAALLGLKAAVVVIVAEAVIRIGRRALTDPRHWVTAGAAFLAIHLLGAPFPLVIIAAMVLGFTLSREAGSGSVPAPLPSARLSGRGPVLATLAAWLIPLGAIVLLAGPESILARIGVFFSEMAMVTFGGAYAVLTYVAQRAVEGYGWLSGRQMADGLGLAETTPGPLILVLQFVAFQAGYRYPVSGVPLVGGLLASLVGLWVLFAPSFLWIFLGGPYVERVAANPRLGGALHFVTAAVVGVVLNLAIWFAAHVLFGEVTSRSAGPIRWLSPAFSSFDWAAAALVALEALLLFGFRLGVVRSLLATTGAGVALALALGRLT